MSAEPVILVTAGSAGLGAATARLFAQHGYRVAVNYSNNRGRAETLVRELNGQNNNKSQEVQEAVRHVAIQADLSCHTDIQHLVQETYSVMKRIDVVFSNGGWTRFTDTTSIDDNALEDDWDKAFNMNVKSHLWLLQASRPYLEEAEGAFITTSSIAGIQGMGSSLAYAATKAAQIHMMRGLACMVAPRIRVNTVSPGLLETDWAARFTEEQKESHREKTKLKRFVTVEDVAAQVFSLAMSRSITGANIIVDAGYTL